MQQQPYEYEYIGDVDICFLHYPFRIKKGDKFLLIHDFNKGVWGIVESKGKELIARPLSEKTMEKLHGNMRIV